MLIGGLIEKSGRVLAWAVLAGCLAAAPRVAGAEEARLAAFLGSWEGSAICINMDRAPRCVDETVIYDVRPAEKPGIATLTFSKIGDGQKEFQYEVDFTYDESALCWQGEYPAPGWPAIYRFTIKGGELTGSESLQPENVAVRSFQLKRR